MEKKECKIVCDGKEVATVSCSEDGLNIKHTKEGKEMCRKMHKESAFSSIFLFF